MPGAAELIDLWLDLRLVEGTRLRVGQTKVPFTRYRQLSFRDLLLVDWADASPFFGGERQLGALVAGTFERWGWSLGAFTGANRRAAHGIGVQRVYAEPLASPSTFGEGRGVERALHPELVGYVSHGSAGFDARRPGAASPAAGGGYLATLSAAVDARPEAGRDALVRLAPELWLRCGGTALIAVGYLAWVDRSGSEGPVFGLGGMNLELAQRLGPLWELAARYERVDVAPALRRDARQRADALVAAAPPEAMDALGATYADAGTLRSQQSVLVGVNAFAVGRSVRAQLDAGWRRLERSAGRRDEARVRLQVQLAF